jgi:hypothetical protein
MMFGKFPDCAIMPSLETASLFPTISLSSSGRYFSTHGYESPELELLELEVPSSVMLSLLAVAVIAFPVLLCFSLPTF